MRGFGGDEERVRDAARRDEDAIRADAVLLTVDVDKQFPLQDVDRLVFVGVQVHRRRLAAHDPIFK